MSRSTTERQAPEVTQGVTDTDAELTKAVDFATLISMSSLSAPDVQNDRLTGRKEIAARLAEQVDAFGLEAPLERFTPATGSLDPLFECRVADQLELRGHTFEAELRYRRLQNHPVVATRLAFLLDAKGFQQDSWQWYLRSARANDPNALFRLATICWSRGDRGWAMRLAKHAVAHLVPDTHEQLLAGISNLVHQREAASSPYDHILVRSILSSPTSTDAIYALGSVLLVLASRPDLARLAYCSAMARGHSLSTVSLLNLARAAMVKKTGNWRLSNILHDGLTDDLQKYTPVVDQRDDFDRALLLLKNEMQDETLEGLIRAIRAPTDRRDDAIDRIMATTQLITNLRGYGQLGFDTRASQYIAEAADAVTKRALQELITGGLDDATSLIHMIREWSLEALSHYGRSDRHGPKCQQRKKRKTRECKNEVAMSGTLRRLGTEYSELPPEQREALILQLAGLYPDEVAKVLGCRRVDADQMFAHTVTRLQEAQQGEQLPTGKLLGAEIDSCFSVDMLKLIASLPEWKDTGASSWRGQSPNPTQLLRRRRVRTMLASTYDPRL